MLESSRLRLECRGQGRSNRELVEGVSVRRMGCVVVSLLEDIIALVQYSSLHRWALNALVHIGEWKFVILDLDFSVDPVDGGRLVHFELVSSGLTHGA